MQISKLATFAVLGFVIGSAHAQTSDQMQKAMVAGARYAGSNARLATDVCQIDKNQVEAYKSSSKKAYALDQNFESDWAAGWQKAQGTVSAYQKLKTSDPADYAQKKSATCTQMAAEMKS